MMIIDRTEPIIVRTNYGWSPSRTEHQVLYNHYLTSFENEVLVWSGDKETYYANATVTAWISRAPHTEDCHRAVVQVIWPLTLDAPRYLQNVRDTTIGQIVAVWRGTLEGTILVNGCFSSTGIDGAIATFAIGRDTEVGEIIVPEGYNWGIFYRNPIFYPGLDT